jgi:hypothetical protein
MSKIPRFSIITPVKKVLSSIYLDRRFLLIKALTQTQKLVSFCSMILNLVQLLVANYWFSYQKVLLNLHILIA